MGKDPSGGVNPYILTFTAERDLESIWRYIANDSRHYADAVEHAVLETCCSVAAFPGMGHRREGVGDPNVLFVAVQGFESYLIAYAANVKPLSVVRIVHGARDVPRFFRLKP